jgi:hypothetical protein
MVSDGATDGTYVTHGTNGSHRSHVSHWSHSYFRMRIELRWAMLARQRDENDDDSRRLRDDMLRVYRPATPPHVPLWPDRFASSSYR